VGDLGIGKLELWAFTDLKRDDVIARLRYLDVGSPRFRSRVDYSNPNISAAGQAAATAAGSNWDTLIQSRLLRPLGMASATINVDQLWRRDQHAPCYMYDLEHPTPSLNDAAIDNIAMPHIVTAKGLKTIPWRTVDNIAPAGSINATVVDFARFMTLHLQGGEFNDRRLVAPETIREMHSPQAIAEGSVYPVGEGFNGPWYYGLGWWITNYRGHKVVMHTGGVTGWRSGIVMFPDQGIGIAMVSNQHSKLMPSSLAPALGFEVFDRLMGMQPLGIAAEWLENTRKGYQLPNEVGLNSNDNSNSAPDCSGSQPTPGLYSNPAFGELELEPDARTLVISGVMRGKLQCVGKDQYMVVWGGPWSLSYPAQVEPQRLGRSGTLHIDRFGAFTFER